MVTKLFETEWFKSTAIEVKNIVNDTKNELINNSPQLKVCSVNLQIYTSYYIDNFVGEMNITKTHHIPFTLKYNNLLSNGVYIIDDIQPSQNSRLYRLSFS